MVAYTRVKRFVSKNEPPFRREAIDRLSVSVTHPSSSFEKEKKALWQVLFQKEQSQPFTLLA